MTYTNIVRSAKDWDVPVNAAFTDLDTRVTSNTSNIATNTANITTAQNTANTASTNAGTALFRTAGNTAPYRHGLASWAFDPVSVVGGQTGTAGTLYLVSLWNDTATTLTKFFWGISTAGASPTAGQNFIGLYDNTGTRLANVNVDARVTVANTMQTETINVAVSPNTQYWGAFLFNATTMPSVWRGGFISGQLVNANLGNSTARFATNGTGLTALPASITPSSNNTVMYTFWCAVA